MAKISVLGAGSWGTALSVLLSNNGHEVRLWSRFQEEVDALKETRELTSKLPGVHIPENIDLTADMKSCVETAEVIVLAVPSPYVRSTSRLMAPDVREGQIIVNVAKGIEEKTLMTMTDIISEEIPAAGVYVLSGPSHAEEVGRGLPTTCVISGPKRETAEYLQGIFTSPRLYDTGYARRRAWRFSQERDRTCGRNRRRTWIWGQHQGGSDHTRDCGDRTPWNEDGRQSGNFWRAFRDRRSDRNLRECPQS